MHTTYFRVIPIIAFCMMLVFPLTAFAQVARTGVIEGRINDFDGLPLPGATITISSPNLIGGDQFSVAAADGRFRFPALPTGVYTVAVSMDGFDSQTQSDVRLSMGTTADVIFTMTIGATDTITVRGEPPLVDIKSTGSAQTVITGSFSQSLPSGRSAAGLIAYVPGVVGNNDGGAGGGRTLNSGRSSSAFGGTTQGTQFIFDGIQMNSPEGGEVEVRTDFDDLEEASFTGVGGAAEVGGYSGIVVNLVTKSGSNDVHGAANFFYIGDSFVGENSDDPEFQRDISNNKQWHVDVGGPLVRDKLWGFGSFRRETSNEASEIAAGDPGFDKNNFAFFKLTWQINPNAKLSGHFQRETDEGKRPGNAFTSPEVNLPGFNNISTYNLDYLHIFSDNTFLDVKFGSNDGATGDFPIEARRTLPAGHLILDGAGPLCGTPDGCDEFLTESPGFFFDGFRNRYQTNVALSHYADDFLNGTHDFKVGFQGDWSLPKTNIGYTGECCGGAAFYEDLSPGEPDLKFEFQSLEIDPLGRTLSFYLQDSWTLNNGRVTINPGLRINDYTGSAKARVGAITGFASNVQDLGAHFKPDLAIAPRIGFVADLFGNGNTALKAHWGRYFPQLIAGTYAGFQSFAAVEFQESVWNPDTGLFDVDFTDFAPEGLKIDPDLQMTNFTEFSMGIEQQLTPVVAVEVSGLVRKTNNFIDKVRLNGMWEAVPVQDLAGNDFIVYNLLNSDEAIFLLTNTDDLDRSILGPEIDGFEQTRDFWSLNFTVEKRFSNRWQAQGSYVYSRATGTDDTDFENGRGSSLGPSDLWEDPNTRFFSDGSLNHDVPHQIKFLGSVVLPYEVLFGWFYNGSSGRPYTKEVRFRRGVSETTSVEMNTGRIQRFVEPRGSRRLPWVNNIDLRAEKAFTVDRYTFSVLFDIFNLFNSNTVVRVRDREDPNSSTPFERVLRIKYPRNFRLGIRFDF